MGRKRIGPRERIYFFIALLISFSVFGCVSPGLQEMSSLEPAVEMRELESTGVGLYDGKDPWQHMQQADRFLALGKYEASLREEYRALALSSKGSPGDEILFNIAMIYAHPGNQKKDCEKSIGVLRRITKEYPRSIWSDRAKVWAEVLQENVRLKKRIAEISQEVNKLKKQQSEASQENDRLKQVIEQSKQIDAEIEGIKREKAR